MKAFYEAESLLQIILQSGSLYKSKSSCINIISNTYWNTVTQTHNRWGIIDENQRLKIDLESDEIMGHFCKRHFKRECIVFEFDHKHSKLF